VLTLSGRPSPIADSNVPLSSFKPKEKQQWQTMKAEEAVLNAHIKNVLPQPDCPISVELDAVYV